LRAAKAVVVGFPASATVPIQNWRRGMFLAVPRVQTIFVATRTTNDSLFSDSFQTFNFPPSPCILLHLMMMDLALLKLPKKKLCPGTYILLSSLKEQFRTPTFLLARRLIEGRRNHGFSSETYCPRTLNLSTAFSKVADSNPVNTTIRILSFLKCRRVFHLFLSDVEKLTRYSSS
jgi:hypothetical protein